ncbi:MAG: LVIVD repeat-containing protein, partial [Candidatus Heimdallarchaeota archaeon]
MKPKTIVYANKTVSVILVIITVITFAITNYSIQGSIFDKTKGSPIQTDFQSNLAINDEVFEVGFWEKNLGRIDNVYVNDSLAYISGGDVTLTIANITDTTEPEIIGSYESEFSSSYSTQLHQLGDIMFIAKGSNGLDVVNISNPYAPTHIGHRGSYSFRSIAVKDHYMFSADLMLDLRVFNLINLSNILLTTTKNEGSSGSYALELVDNYVYLANGNDGLKIYNVTYPTLPEFVSKIDVAGTVYIDIEVLDNIAYILDSADHILTFNVSDVTNPVHLGTFNGTNYSNLFLNDNLLYVTKSNFPNGFEILNCTNPGLLTTVHLENYEGVTTSIYVINNESYITDWNN